MSALKRSHSEVSTGSGETGQKFVRSEASGENESGMEKNEFGSEKEVVKGPWSPEEDELMRKAVEKYGNADWKSVSSMVPGRTSKQCRDRYKLKLDPTINHGPWTPEEDQRLLELQKQYGRQWTKIAKLMPGRTENSVKSRSASLERSRNREWLDEEDQILRNCCSRNISYQEISEKYLCKRTVHAVQKRWEKLFMKDLAEKIKNEQAQGVGGPGTPVAGQGSTPALSNGNGANLSSSSSSILNSSSSSNSSAPQPHPQVPEEYAPPSFTIKAELYDGPSIPPLSHQPVKQEVFDPTIPPPPSRSLSGTNLYPSINDGSTPDLHSNSGSMAPPSGAGSQRFYQDHFVQPLPIDPSRETPFPPPNQIHKLPDISGFGGPLPPTMSATIKSENRFGFFNEQPQNVINSNRAGNIRRQTTSVTVLQQILGEPLNND